MSKTVVIAATLGFLFCSTFTPFFSQEDKNSTFHPTHLSVYSSFDEQDLFINGGLSWKHFQHFESQFAFGLGFRRTFFSGVPLPKLDYQFRWNVEITPKISFQPFIRYYISSIALNRFGGERTYYQGFAPGLNWLVGSERQFFMGFSTGISEYWEQNNRASKSSFLGYQVVLGVRFKMNRYGVE